GQFDVTFELTNTGFAAPVHSRRIIIVLRDGESSYLARLHDRDVRTWGPGAVILQASLRLPAQMKPGTYELGLWLADGARSLMRDPRYAIRLANQGVWRDDGVNVLSTQVVIDPAAQGPVDPAATEFLEL